MINNLVLLYRGCSDNYYKDLNELSTFNCYLKNNGSQIVFIKRNIEKDIILLIVHSECENIREYIKSYLPEQGKIEFSDSTNIYDVKSNILSRLFDDSTGTEDISFKRLSQVTDNFLSVCTDVVLSIFNEKHNSNSDNVADIIIQLNVAFCNRIGYGLNEISELYDNYFKLLPNDNGTYKNSQSEGSELVTLCKDAYISRKHSYYRIIKVLAEVFSNNDEFEEDWITNWFSGITELRNDIMAMTKEYKSPIIEELLNKFYSLLLHELHCMLGIDIKSEASIVYILKESYKTLNQIKSGNKQSLESSLITECKRIAEQIILDMKTDVNGTYWISYGFDDENKFVQKISESLSSGVSGIALFFGAMYDITDEEKYLHIYEQSLNWIVKYCEVNKTSDYSFLTGRMGAAYLMIKSEKYFNDKYIKNALDIAYDCDNAFTENNLSCEYFKGSAGILISLLHLYDATGEGWILEKIDRFFKHIVGEINYGENGVYWDRSGYTIKGLSGFSHGVSGIFFALIELGNYFNNRTILNLAEQAYQYEKSLLDKGRMNWKDNRIGIFSDNVRIEYRNAYIKKDFTLFCNPNYVYGWCHGSPGIALTRLKAYEILKHPDYKREFDMVTDTLLNDDKIISIETKYFTLCHGIGSLIEVLFEARNIHNNNQSEEKINEICTLMLDDYNTKNKYTLGNDIYDRESINYGLLNGISGIGYSYLRAIDSVKIDSILLPRINKTRNHNRKLKEYYFDIIDDRELSGILIKKFFRRTFNLLEIFERTRLEIYLKEFKFDKNSNVLKDFISYVEELIKENRMGVNYLRDIFKHERSILDLDTKIASYALINTRFEMQHSLIKNLLISQSSLLDVNLISNPDTNSNVCQYDWSEYTENKQIDIVRMKPVDTYMLLIVTVEGVQEKRTDKLIFDVYDKFNIAKSVREVVESFEKHQHMIVIECIKSLLEDCFLVID